MKHFHHQQCMLQFKQYYHYMHQEEQLVLYYQPKIDLKTFHIVGAEALLRWQHPEIGLVPPGDFITVAEETGLIVPIGEWVLRTACQQIQQWEQTKTMSIRVSVNLSGRQFHNTDLSRTINQIIEETAINPAMLELELTESILMKEGDSSVHVLNEFKKMGLSVSVDDFGTGYSSLNYLKRLPLDILKIDRSFVEDIEINSDDTTIIKTIIAMAHNLNLKVIAEGVETMEQMDFLIKHGCEEAQGYLFSKPLPADEFEQLFQDQQKAKSRSS